MENENKVTGFFFSFFFGAGFDSGFGVGGFAPHFMFGLDAITGALPRVGKQPLFIRLFRDDYVIQV